MEVGAERARVGAPELVGSGVHFWMRLRRCLKEEESLHRGEEGREFEVEDFLEVRDVSFAKHRYRKYVNILFIVGDGRYVYPRTPHT